MSKDVQETAAEEFGSAPAVDAGSAPAHCDQHGDRQRHVAKATGEIVSKDLASVVGPADPTPVRSDGRTASNSARRQVARRAIGGSRVHARGRHQYRQRCAESTRALVAAVEAKDPCTRQHSVTVASIAGALGKRLGLSKRELSTLREAALLHDVGKIGVPDAILTKPGPLTSDEYATIQRHPETALEILSYVSFCGDERLIILHHHEHYDGHGYPDGLAGDKIPLGSRILSVADAIDAMASRRSYKPPFSVECIRRELTSGSGTQFDPDVVRVALEWLVENPPSDHSEVAESGNRSDRD